MAQIRLDRIDWTTALAADPARRPPGVTTAALESLSAIAAPDFSAGMAQLRKVARLEPLNPLHQVRMALLLARFGNLAAATQVLDRLKEKLPPTPSVDYLRALFALRAGALDKARGMLGSLETAYPKLVQVKFLRAEAQIVTSKPSTVEKHLLALPAGPEWEPCWADLLVKLVLLHPQEGPALAQKYIGKKLAQGSDAHALVLRAMAWACASADEIADMIPAESTGSRSEALMLECLAGKLDAETSEAALATLRRIGAKDSARPALRRIYDSLLTRRATELSGQGDYEGALRLVEQSLRRQPYDLVYHQNRAALFTLLREAGPYQEAWAALNAHQYRLLLLGTMDDLSLTQIVKTHRLFAQQARGGALERGARGGIFRMVEGESGDKPYLRMNAEDIAKDPDLLRQWIHHTRAELVFQHVKLGNDGRTALLAPADRDQAMERARSLTFLGESLSVLVPEEGAELEAIFASHWLQMAARVSTRYETAKSPFREAGSECETEEDGDGPDKQTPLPNQPNAADALLRLEHLNTLADLCLICLQWSPAHDQLAVCEELLDFTEAEIAFFEVAVLKRVTNTPGQDAPYAVRALAGQMRAITGVERGPVSAEQQRRTIESCMAELLRMMAWSAYNGHSGSARESATQALVYADRARQLNPADPRIELTAAQLLALGEYLDEARQALERYNRVKDPDNERDIETASKVAELLRDKHKEGKTGERRTRDLDVDNVSPGHEARIAELQQDIDRSPGVWRLYEDLVKELAAAGRFDDAIDWADRSVAHCLRRAEQMNARGLAIEARGMHKLAEDNPRAARLFAVGAHEPARKALESLAQQSPLNYAQLYLLGQCELAAGLPAEAQESFHKAADLCSRPLHRTVLRSLAENIDSAYISVARTRLNDALQEGEVGEALQQAFAVFPRLQEPGAWLLDFARVYYSLALSRAGLQSTAALPEAPPQISFQAPWMPGFQQAIGQASLGERALALALLAGKVHAASTKQAMVLVERVKALNRRMETVDTLNRAGTLLSERKFAAAIQLLDGKADSISSEPRLLRIKALALLGLRRFDDADSVVEQIGNSGSAEVQEFAAQYPALAFRQRLAVALELLRQAKPGEADETLRGAVPITEKDAHELAYCRAFSGALQGYELRRKGQPEEARKRFLAAMDLIEPLMQDSADTLHVTELYDRMEKEVDRYAST
jgi:tetratricopeptide (TPR) repeat protein